MGHDEGKGLHLLEGFRNWKPEEIEGYLTHIREDAQYVRDYALELSGRRKRPVLILCNARAGTLLHYPIAGSREDEESDVGELFREAAGAMEKGSLEAFVHSLSDIKINSYNQKSYYGWKKGLGPYNPVIAVPECLDELVQEGYDILFVDCSRNEFPGSFSEDTGKPPLSGFKEFLRSKAKKYAVILSSRRFERSKNSPGACLKRAIRTRGPVALCLNALPKEHTEASNFLDDRPELLGEFGYEMGKDGYGVEEYRPVYIESTEGKMELSEFVERYLRSKGASSVAGNSTEPRT